MLSNDIWVFAEYRDHEVAPVTLEMLTEARKLAPELNKTTCACLIGYNLREYIAPLQNYGAEKVHLIDNEVFSDYSLDAYVFALQKLIEQYKPLITMFGATPWGSELAPRLAARLKLPCITEVKRIGVQKDNLFVARSLYEDKVYQNSDFKPETTLVLTVLPGDMDSEETTASSKAGVVEEDIHLEPDMLRTRKIRFIKGDPKKLRLEEADLIVAGGKGIGKNLEALEELADLLDASIGGTRPLVDEELIPFERQIGITGKSVSPHVLMICGASGASEFTTGIKKAKVTIGINTDARAPIFKSVDVAIHGDMNEIIPVLVQRLRQSKGQNA
jgi:electron transfer flavoprotein alpha subunit